MEFPKKHKNRELQELTATLQRLQADFENYKKRVDKEKQQTKEMTAAAVIQRLLPVIDAFELALKNKNDAQFQKGMELIYTQLMSALREQGLKPIDTLGKKLDTTKHEVLLQEVTQNGQDEQIIEELQKGYTLNDQTIRTSKVKIAKTAQKDETNDQQGNAAEGH